MENELILKENLFKGRETFIQYLDVSNITMIAYKHGIECFFEYLKEKNIQSPTRTDFKAFREELKQTMSVNTINSYMTAVRCFFKYLEANKLYENITKDVKSLKTSRNPKTQVLSQEQCIEIYKGLTDAKEKAIFSIAITTGLRANEIANAKLDNIKTYNGETVLFVKTKKRDDETEYVKLSDEVLNDIKNYVEQRTTGYIFVSTSNNNKNGGLSSTSIRNIVKTIFRRYGIDEDYFSCHTLRRSFATIAYMNGENIYDIQQVLHHSSISTTTRYINQVTRDTNKAEFKISKAILG